MISCKRALRLVVTTALLLGLCGCGGFGKRTLKMNVAAPDGSVQGVAAETFAQIVEEDSGGHWRVEIAYARTDNDAVQTLERLLNGKADVDLRSVTDLQKLDGRLSAFSLPWLFADYQDADRRLLNGPGGETVCEWIRAIGMEPLALAENGFLQVTNDRRPISAPADFRGLTIRVPDNAQEAALFETFGAKPVALDWDGTFSALQDGAIDGQQNALDAIRVAQVDCVQRYLTVWNACYDPLCLSVSAQLWESLSEEDRELFQTAAREACAAEVAASRAREAETLSAIRAGGAQVTELTETQIQNFRVVAAPLYDAWKQTHGAETLSALDYSG